jgi:hypothetical protein
MPALCWLSRQYFVAEPVPKSTKLRLAAVSGNYTVLNERATEFGRGEVLDELVIVF